MQQSTVHAKLKRLERLGYIRASEARPRAKVTYDLTEKGRSLLSETNIFATKGKYEKILLPTIPAAQISVDVISANPVQVGFKGPNGSFVLENIVKGSSTYWLHAGLTLYINTFGSSAWVRCSPQTS